jgi:hypothetical protein
MYIFFELLLVFSIVELFIPAISGEIIPCLFHQCNEQDKAEGWEICEHESYKKEINSKIDQFFITDFQSWNKLREANA